MKKLSPLGLIVLLSLTLACAGPPAPGTPAESAPAAATTPGSQKSAQAAATPSGGPAVQAPGTIRLVVPTSSVGAWALDVAERKGFFQQQALSVDRAAVEAGKVVEELNSGGRDVVLTRTDAVVRAARDGRNLVMVAGALNRAPFSLIAARDVEDVGGLTGRPLGVQDPGGLTGEVLKRLLEARNLDEANYRLIGFGERGLRAAAVANRTVGGSLLEPAETARMEASGFKNLGHASEVVPNFQAEVLAAKKDWAQQNEELLVRFLSALVAAQRWIYAQEDSLESVDILATSLNVTASEAKRVYEQYVEKLSAIPRAGELEQQGVQTVIDLLVEADAIPPPPPDAASLIDSSYVSRAR